MGHYYNVRGFLDCAYADVPRVKEIVHGFENEAEQFDLTLETVQTYITGWLFQEKTINSGAHVFFGATMRADALELIFTQLERIVTSIEEIEGTFFVDDDEKQDFYRWDIRAGRVKVEGGGVRWLEQSSAEDGGQ